MKYRIFALALLISILLSPAFAATSYDDNPDFFSDRELFNPGVTFSPISARMEAMGGAGLAVTSGSDSFFLNPANLGDGKFSIHLPEVSVTLFNPKRIIDSGIIEDLGEDEPNPMLISEKFLNTLNSGKGDILTTDIATSFTVGGFGMGLHIQEQLHNYGKSTTAKLFAELNAAASFGVGFRIPLVDRLFSVDFGATVRPTYKAYTSAVSTETFESLFGGESSNDPMDTILGELPLAAGYAIPIDIGLNVNLPLGFRVSTVARNLNGTFYMQEYSESGMWVNEIMDLTGQTPVEYTSGTAQEITNFPIEVPWSLDMGLGWMPDFGGIGRMIRPTFALDFVDLVGFTEKQDNEHAIWDHLRLGAELQLFSFIDIRAGLNRGARSIGVGFNLFVIHIDAAYYWREMGMHIGDKPVDALTLRFSIGVDSN